MAQSKDQRRSKIRWYPIWLTRLACCGRRPLGDDDDVGLHGWKVHARFHWGVDKSAVSWCSGGGRMRLDGGCKADWELQLGFCEHDGGGGEAMISQAKIRFPVPAGTQLLFHSYSHLDRDSQKCHILIDVHKWFTISRVLYVEWFFSTIAGVNIVNSSESAITCQGRLGSIKVLKLDMYRIISTTPMQVVATRAMSSNSSKNASVASTVGGFTGGSFPFHNWNSRPIGSL